MDIRGRSLPAGEGSRKAVHAGMGLFALALPVLSWPAAAACAVAAFLFNWLLLPRILGHRLASARSGGSDRGVLLYPVVVLVMILVFRDGLALVALGWGMLAFGDAAAGLVGQKWGRHPLPWNPDKSWEGWVAFVVAGTVSGSVLFGWFVAVSGALDAAGPLDLSALAGLGATVAVRVGAVAVAPALLAGVLESLPHGLDDNVVPPMLVPLAVAAVIVGEGYAGAPGGLVAAVAVNTACAAAAFLGRVLRRGGIAVAWLLGVLTWVAAGPRGFAVLLVFLLAGTALTFVGYGRKQAVGAAERSGGRRGAAEILAKGGVLMTFAATALISAATDALPWWIVAAALGAAAADTWGTEIGTLWGRRAFTLAPVRRVAPGTPGAVSWAGLCASLAGAVFTVGVAVAVGLPETARGLDGGVLVTAAAVAAAAFLAALTESVLPTLGPASHAGKNLAVTALGPLYAYILLGVLS